MIFIEADNILSPLGMTTEQNVEAVMVGRSALRAHTDERGLLEPYTASIFTAEQNAAMAIEGLSPFESMLVRSARAALSSPCYEKRAFDVASPRTVLIVSSTKGNVEQLCPDTDDTSELSLARSAERIAKALGVTTTPLTVCNACISGLAAIILAGRLLEAGDYDHAIVCGADRQSEFIISGFQSLKALSSTACRPFDMERTGLNLGEAAATIILSSRQTRGNQWTIRRGAIHNDAYHTTQPAKRGDGLLLCLEDVLKEGSDDIALINAHGTATLFNDQMESVAIERAGLTDIPVNALKGYFGHTMGAAGILESIITMHALDNHIIIGTRGYEERGVSGRIRLSSNHQHADKTSFIKTISGFGGCNAAVLFERGEGRGERGKRKEEGGERGERIPLQLETIRNVHITPHEVLVDGKAISTEGTGLALLTYLYKVTGGNYPKFYKMDALSRLGYVAVQLISGNGCDAVLFFNRSSSIAADRKYLASIADKDNYFPSPSVFIYTLPNIVTGELAIRHGFHGETSFYILPEKNEALQEQIVRATLADTDATSLLTGWLDWVDETHFEADIQMMTIKKQNKNNGNSYQPTERTDHQGA